MCCSRIEIRYSRWKICQSSLWETTAVRTSVSSRLLYVRCSPRVATTCIHFFFRFSSELIWLQRIAHSRRTCFSILLLISRSHSHTPESIYNNQLKFLLWCSHCSVQQSIRNRDIRRMEEPSILSLLAHATHFIVRFNCHLLHNMSFAHDSRLSTVLAIYSHQKFKIHIGNEMGFFFVKNKNKSFACASHVNNKRCRTYTSCKMSNWHSFHTMMVNTCTGAMMN